MFFSGSLLSIFDKSGVLAKCHHVVDRQPAIQCREFSIDDPSKGVAKVNFLVFFRIGASEASGAT